MEEKRRQKLEEDQVRHLPPCDGFGHRVSFCLVNVGVFVTKGSARGSDAADVGQEPESQTEAQSLVLGRSSAAQLSQRSSGYLYP